MEKEPKPMEEQLKPLPLRYENFQRAAAPGGSTPSFLCEAASGERATAEGIFLFFKLFSPTNLSHWY
jgi:hypothetical protein